MQEEMIEQGIPFSISELESKMLEVDQVECPVIHRFGPGLYIREVKIPAGTIAIGHKQKFDHMNLFLQGNVIMLNEDGTTSELKAPMIFTGKPGRKVGYIVEDMVWLNIYPTDETDVEKLEDTYLDKSEGWKENKALRDRFNAGMRIADGLDYNMMLSEFGFTEEDVRKQTEDESDQVEMPAGDYKFLISDSNIQGKGVFASASMLNGEMIGPARIDGKRTPLGRYANHSVCPNSEMKDIGGDIYMIATDEIMGCHGGFNGDEITTDYRLNLKLIGVEKCLQ